MVVCYSHSLLPLCQLTLTSPLARGDILSCSASGCLCGDFLFRFVCRWAGGASPSPTVTYAATGCLCIKLSSASRADRQTTNCRPYGVTGSFLFVCRFR